LGAFTGEVSAFMLASMGVQKVIVGHSERRQYFGEDDTVIKSKVNVALEAKLHPIFCCGETKEVRISEQQEQHIFYQLKDNLFHLSEEQFSQITIAYEPIWAIGTGMTATPAQAEQMHAFIRKEIAHRYSPATAENTSILYGGSVNAANAKALFSQPNIDGGLVGGASLKAQDFITIINSI
jgi:triosephosphate isomerase